MNSNFFKNALSIFAFFVFTALTVNAQLFAEEQRPFDFSDKYYLENGLIASAIVDRKTGDDGHSVLDYVPDWRYRDVRITATLPAYDKGGSVVFWNLYGGGGDGLFINNAAGIASIQQAYANPIYIFPSSTVDRAERQAALIQMADSYFDKNPLGLAAVLIVEYNKQIFTPRGQTVLQQLNLMNGSSLDGTPIIKTEADIEKLSLEGLIDIKKPGLTGSTWKDFAIAKVLDPRKAWSIAGDAFLIYVTEDGKPLAAETHILSKFECLRSGSADVCSSK